MSKHKKQPKKTLSIIIPFFGQTETDLAIPLSSINSQVGVDFAKLDVHLVNDGGKALNPEAFKIFAHLDLHYHDLPENVGPGMARQYGIDHSEGEYVMFVDADDELLGTDALRLFFEASKEAKHKMIVSNFLFGENVAKIGLEVKSRLVSKDSSDLWYSALYAKWYSRDFLEKFDIRFQPELMISEDFYFASLSLIFAGSAYLIDDKTYRRNFRKDSMMNASGGQAVKKFSHHYFIAQRLKLEKIREKTPDKWRDSFCYCMVDMFLYLKKKDIDPKACRDELKKFISEFPYHYPDDFLKMEVILKGRLSKDTSDFKGMSGAGFEDFMKQL